VAQVEVLKGPQSTLYGASALGGLIRITTKKPDFDRFSGDLRVDGAAVDGGGVGGGIRGAVNIPIANDKLALSLSAFDRLDPGYVDNTLTGQKNVNSDHGYGGHAALRWKPTDRLDIELAGFLQRNDARGISQEEGIDPTTLQPTEGRYKYSNYFNSPLDTRFAVGSLTVTYGLDAGSITSATSYGSYKSDAGQGIISHLYPMLLGFTDPETVDAVSSTEMQKFTQEFLFNSKRLGPLEFQAGLFYTHEQDKFIDTFTGRNGVTGATLPAPFDNLLTENTPSTYAEYAGFADVTWYITPRLDATAGVRESHNVQTSDATPTGLLIGAASGVSVPLRLNASDTSYLFTIRWRPTDNVSAYVRAASAYRPGGPQFSPGPGVPNLYQPDTVWDYEGGVKGNWFGGRLSADADIYYLDWKNIQLGAIANGMDFTGNGGNAHSEGVELQGQLKPVQGLVMGLNLAYDQTRMDFVNAQTLAANAAGGGSGAQVGDQLPLTPKWSGALTADYSFPVANATGTLGATYHYQGSVQTGFTGITAQLNTTLRAYSVFDLRARLDWKRYAVVFQVDNLFGEYALANLELLKLAPLVPNFPVVSWGFPIQPRTFRLSFEARF
jgi:outer membrane receptor protein involved in Fe transport